VGLWHQEWVEVVALTQSLEDHHSLGKWQMGKKMLTYSTVTVHCHD
jgi:hypothetical protein